MPIPFLGSLWTKPVTRLRWPASSGKAKIDKALRATGTILAVLLVIAYLISRGYTNSAPQNEFAPVTDQPRQLDHFVTMLLIVLITVIGIYWLAGILRILNVNAVTIVHRDDVSAELCFKREDYAREFCALNELTCHDRSSAQRKKERGV